MSALMPLLQVVVEIPAPPTPPSPPMPPADVHFPPDVMMPPAEGMVGGPPEWVGMVFVILAAIIGATIILAPLARAWARRIDRGAAQPQVGASDSTARLERIETAVEAMALEVERISEGQRFLTRVMSELRSLPQSAGSSRAEPPYRTPR